MSAKLLPVVIFVLFINIVTGADPVYTPVTLSDNASNHADNNSQISWGPLPAGDAYSASSPSRVSEGLTAYYNMMHGFVDSVFIKGFPNEIIQKMADGEASYLVENYKNYIPYFVGYGICVVVGILFLLIFPIVACCFCCCRCCGNCGGDRYQAPENAGNKCKKFAFTIIVVISTAFLITSAACIYVNNDNMSAAFTTAPVTVRENLVDLERYANNTLDEAIHLVDTNFRFVQTALFRDLDNIDYLVGLPLREEIKKATNITTTLASAYGLVYAMDYTDKNLSAVETALSDMKTALTNLTTAIDSFTTSMSNIENSCTACTGTFPNYDSAGSDVDADALPDLNGARTSLDNAKSSNLTATILDAEAEIVNIPETVKNDSDATVSDMKTEISDLSDKLDGILDQIKDAQGQVSGENASVNLKDLANQIDDLAEVLEQYDQYRWYGGLGLACIVLLVTVLAVLGLAFGFIGSSLQISPTDRGCMSNCGGVFLMASVGFIMIFSLFLMLLTFPTFMIGAPIQEIVCKRLTDLDELGETLDIIGSNNILASEVLNNDTIDLTVVGFLRDCRDGKSIFTAMKLNDKFDIDDLLNYSKTLDVNAELDKVNVSFDSVEIYSATLQNQLKDLKDAVNISFSDFYTELNKNTSSTNLSALADKIDDYAQNVTDSHKTDLENQATELRRIENEELVYLQEKLTALNTSVANMEKSVANIPEQVDTLDSGLQFADDFIKKNASGLVKDILTTFADRVLSIIDSYVDFTIRNKLGACTPVWNVYNSLVIYTFCYNFIDCFNGLWFALGWSVFFFMVSLIFSVKLSKFYRRMHPRPTAGHGKVAPEGSNQEIPQSHSKAEVWRRNNKVGPYDDCQTPAPPPDYTNPDIKVIDAPPMFFPLPVITQSGHSLDPHQQHQPYEQPEIPPYLLGEGSEVFDEKPVPPEDTSRLPDDFKEGSIVDDGDSTSDSARGDKSSLPNDTNTTTMVDTNDTYSEPEVTSVSNANDSKPDSDNMGSAPNAGQEVSEERSITQDDHTDAPLNNHDEVDPEVVHKQDNPDHEVDSTAKSTDTNEETGKIESAQVEEVNEIEQMTKND